MNLKRLFVSSENFATSHTVGVGTPFALCFVVMTYWLISHLYNYINSVGPYIATPSYFLWIRYPEQIAASFGVSVLVFAFLFHVLLSRHGFVARIATIVGLLSALFTMIYTIREIISVAGLIGSTISMF